MARRAVSITALGAAGAVSAALVLWLTVGSLLAVASRAEGFGLAPADWAALRFTLWQAALSALISVAIAVPLARALVRRRFAGRKLLITLMGAPFILPVIVAILGLVAVFGRGGVMNTVLAALGLPAVSIYGLQGILLAHVFFNLPLATRLILQGWQSIPAERFRLAQSLNFRPVDIFRIIERPMLREVLPGAFVVIFILCTTSFAVALALGGGPKATTIELAIYQSFRFDFDLGRASSLALVQLLICALAALVAVRTGVPQVQGTTLDRAADIPAPGGFKRGFDTAIIALAALFLVVPLAAIALRGLPALALPQAVWLAALRSLVLALGAVVLALALALPLVFAAVRIGRGGAIAQTIGFLTLAASPLVMGTGLFIMALRVANPVALALPITLLVNAAMALPFVMRALMPAVTENSRRFQSLMASLNMPAAARAKLVWWPRLRRPLGFSAGLTGALSMGDLGVIALFSDPDRATLPLQMYRLMSAYRMDQAMGAALLLLTLSLGLFWLFDRGGRWNADH